MGLTRLLSNEDLIGIDIGTNNIKIIRAEIANRKVNITHALICPTPPGAIKDGNIVNSKDISDAIKFTIHTAGIKSANAATAIAGQSVIVRNVVMPKMTEQILRKSISFEASKYISTPIDDNVIEFDILGNTADNQMNVVLVAAPQDMINTHALVLENAGLDPLSIDIEAFATMRSVIEYNPDSMLRNGTLALLDMGASHTEINLIINGSMMLTRTIPIAGNAINGAIKSAESCSEEDAEQRKYSLDLTPLIDSSDIGTVKPSLKAVQQLIDELLREIRRSFNYYQSQLPEGSTDTVIDKIVYTGGASYLQGLIPYTRSRLNVETIKADPVSWLPDYASKNIDGLDEGNYQLFSTALGLVAKEMYKAV